MFFVFLFFFVAVLESASLEKILPDAAQNSEAGDVSPCRSPSTPRHLRYRQPGGKAVTHAQRSLRAHSAGSAEVRSQPGVVWAVRAHPPRQLVHVVNEECPRLESLMGTQGKNRGMNRATRAFATIQLNVTFLSPCPPSPPPPTPYAVSSSGRELALPRLSGFGLRYCHSSGRT